MTTITNFRDLYFAELQELQSVAIQLSETLLRISEVVVDLALTDALARHRKETLIQQQRLDGLLQKHGADRQAHTDQAMQALVRETEKMMSILQGDELRDAGLIASAQKLEHYEIAAYGTAAALAGQLGLRVDQNILHEGLQEAKRADAHLTDLAKSKINRAALAAA